MPYVIALATFLAVTFGIYGVLYRRPAEDPLAARLGGLRYNRPRPLAPTDPEAPFSQRVLRPLMESMGQKVNALLPSTISQRLEGALVQAGLRMKPGQFMVGVTLLAGVLPLVMAGVAVNAGNSPRTVLLIWGGLTALGVYGPRLWLLGKIRRRQKEIWRSLPDAFDLIMASVEAGLGIDAAFQRVVEKFEGPFADELGRAMREISMGRARRDALMDMVERTGVEELRSLINAIVQAEVMGISIGSVIRVQTAVIRTKRRQRAEEQAFKAPIKMVFPLVFFIFPAIMVVIGGPAIIQLRDAF